MLTGKQKRFLRSKAHHLKPIFQVGKIGVNENMIVQVNEALEKRELIKITILQNCLDDKETVAEELQAGTGAEIVQIIGNNIVLYKESKENKEIVLPSSSD
ncbi:ribosome assembly RNA-binding protein YhbY [Ornithinibacillus sp. FSL M8-0202]|uniref:ribosome assembly RNA-binding protein YhbY n=1 Tax=Ornithinibacillus sp. FSL M8-0202 TaxID=2921616 RepID=UPI0030D31263